MHEKQVFGFENLEVWQKARLLVKEIYTLTGNFPVEEKFSLCSQMQRSAVSVASNIAEGNSRSSLKEQLRYTEIAYGSLMELYCQMLISYDLKYIDNQYLETVQYLFKEIYGKLSALRNSQRKRINE